MPLWCPVDAALTDSNCFQAPLAEIKAHPHFNELMGLLKSHILGDRMWPRQLANTLWALGKMGLDDDEFIKPLFAQMERVRHTHLTSKVLAEGSFYLACQIIVNAQQLAHVHICLRSRHPNSWRHCRRSACMVVFDKTPPHKQVFDRSLHGQSRRLMPRQRSFRDKTKGCLAHRATRSSGTSRR